MNCTEPGIHCMKTHGFNLNFPWQRSTLANRGTAVGRALDFWSGGRGFDPRSRIPTGWVSLITMWPAPRSVSMWQHVKVSDISLRARPQGSLVAEDVKKP